MKLLPFILSNIGIVYNKKQDYSNAFASFKKAIDYANTAGSKTPKAQALEGLAKVYLTGKNYGKAENFALRSLAIAKQINSPEWLSDAWQTLSEVYEAQHKTDKALTAYKNYVHFRDSLLNDDKRTELTRKEIEFDYERKDALMKSENDKQLTLAKAKAEKEHIVKNALTSGAAILLFAGFLSFIFYKRKRDAEQQKKEAEFKAQVSDTEMKVLRLQMNPHFIFNGLNSISDYISRHDIQTADCYLTKFAKVMRLTLEYSDQKAISLAEDLHALELYIQLEAARLNNKFSYEIKVDEDIDPENTLVPPMLLQPFVENSIWHGLTDKPGEGRICIEIRREAEMINCIVEDNGVGRKKAGPSGSVKKSLGMKITKARIDILNKLKKSKAAIELFDLQEGLRVQVKLPLELSF
jgi:tetratricopeptide (TPR) repeat protein